MLVDANGVPVSAILTGVNRNDATQLLPLVEAIPPMRGVRGGRPLQKPKVIHADRGYDSETHRQKLRKPRHQAGDVPCSVRCLALGKFRWVVERTHPWLHNFRRLRIRFERRADIHEAFLKLGCSPVC
jgi:transposase